MEKYDVDLSTLTIGDALSLPVVQTRKSHLAMKARGVELVDTATMEIWMETGERPVPVILGRMATLTVKRPVEKDSDPDNWVVHNGADRYGAVPSKWKDNAKFYEYLKHATGANLTGAFVRRRFTITEDWEDGGGWWKQHDPKNNAKTEIPENLRFKYH